MESKHDKIIFIYADDDIRLKRLLLRNGYSVDYAKARDVHVVIRGLRAITDFEYELQNAQTNALLSKGALDTVFLTTKLEYAYLSSSTVKEIASFHGDISMSVPDFVAERVYKKFGYHIDK